MRLCKIFLFVFLFFAAPAIANAQLAIDTAAVVSTCGTPPSTYAAGQSKQITQDTTGTLCTPSVVSIATLPTVPAPYISATVMDFRAFSSIILDCPTAPSAIAFNVSPDAANAANVGTTTALINPIALTAIQNNAASGLVVTSTGAAIAEWSVTGNKFAAFTITGGSCWISGSNS